VKRLNPRRVKVHRCYSVEEAAKLFGVHKNTVRDWLKAGLPRVDSRRPILVLGRQLAGFLHARREHRRRRCRTGEFYCFRCRSPKVSANRTAEYFPITAHSGNLRATCADCGTRMYRRVSLQKLGSLKGDLYVPLPQAEQRLIDIANPSVNCDLEREPHTDAAQSRK
jgi:excisionase family DNA binding protein